MSQDPTNPPGAVIAKFNKGFANASVPEAPVTVPEFCLYLIMILPDERMRLARLKEFCQLYKIEERKQS